MPLLKAAHLENLRLSGGSNKGGQLNTVLTSPAREFDVCVRTIRHLLVFQQSLILCPSSSPAFPA